MEYGEQCVIVAGITMMQESCADNWDIWMEVISFIHCETRKSSVKTHPALLYGS